MRPEVGLDIFHKIVSIVSMKIRTPNRPFQKSWHHLPILGAKKITWGKFHSEDPQQTCVWCFRLSACELTTHYVREKKYNYYTENSRCQCTVQLCRQPGAHELCTPILQDVYILQTCLQSRWGKKRERENFLAVWQQPRDLCRNSWSYNQIPQSISSL